MPQLDFFSFFSQTSWLAFMFWVLYSLFVFFSLPKLFKSLNFRVKKVFSLQKESLNFFFEKKNLFVLNIKFLVQGLYFLVKFGKGHLLLYPVVPLTPISICKKY